MIYTTELFEQLKRQEGHKKKNGVHMAYGDKDGRLIVDGSKVSGKPTIGYGHNLEAKGLSEPIVTLLLDVDIREAIVSMKEHPELSWMFDFGAIGDVRRDVFVNMAFNMGAAGLAKFKNTLQYAKECDYEKAADEMEDSKWFTDVGDGKGGYFDRAEELVLQMRTGQWKSS